MLGSTTSAIEPPACPLRREPPWRSFVEHPTWTAACRRCHRRRNRPASPGRSICVTPTAICTTAIEWASSRPRTDHGCFLDHLVRPGGNQSRNGEKERQPRCRDRVQIPQHARADGCPGTRHTRNQGTHCTKPMIAASFRLSEDSGRSRLPTRLAVHITALQPTSAATATTHKLRKGPEIGPWAQSPRSQSASSR